MHKETFVSGSSDTFPAPEIANPPVVIGLVGLAGVGKSTVARILTQDYGFSRRPFAYHLKAMLSCLGVPSKILDGDAAAKAAPLDCLNGHTTRYAAQTLGTEWGRMFMGDDFWVNVWKRGMPDVSRVVADDVRFENEAAAIRDMGGVLIRVIRSVGLGVGGVSGHASEAGINQIGVDYTVSNGGTVDDLRWELASTLKPLGLVPATDLFGKRST